MFKRPIYNILFFVFHCLLFFYVFGIGLKNYFRYHVFLKSYQEEYQQLTRSISEYTDLEKEWILLDQDWYVVELIKKTLYYVFDDEVVYL